MARVKKEVLTGGGGLATVATPEQELRRTLMTCMLWEKLAYEEGGVTSTRLKKLVPKVDPEVVAKMAVEAREHMKIRTAPLFVLRELARIKGTGRLVADALPRVIQRPKELVTFMEMYWKDGKKPLSAGVKRGLAKAFTQFDDYQLAKYQNATGEQKG